MKVHADQSVTMIDENGIAGEELVLRENDSSVRDGQHGASNGRWIVDAHVWLRVWLAVVDSFNAEGFAGGQRRRRRTERQREPRRSAGLRENACELCAIQGIAP